VPEFKAGTSYRFWMALVRNIDTVTKKN
jgi:hypothetical protein